MYHAERKFVQTAQSGVQSLLELCAHGNRETDQKISRHSVAMETLGDIKTSAQSVEARAVYRAALLCADIVSRHPFASPEGTAKIRSAVTELASLTSLYADGLNEIDIEDQVHAPVETPVEIIAAPIAANDAQAAHKDAAEVLTPLLPLVKDDKLKTALSALMQSTQIEDEDTLPMTAPSAVPPAAPEETHVSFDGLMRPVTNLVLSEARHSGKAVSVSYAADFTNVRQRAAEDLQNLLEVICLTVVARGVSGASKKAAAAPTAFAPPTQITITGKQGGAALQFHIAWRGEDLSGASEGQTHFAHSLTALHMRGGTIEFQPELKLSLAQSSNAKPARPQQSLTVKFPLRAKASVKTEPKFTAPAPLVFVDDMSADLAISAGGAA